MNRADLEHLLRASKAITGEREFVVIGSQSILGRYPDAPRELRQSMEADLYPRFRPELSGLIEGSLGELSIFDQTFGYRADGVTPDTAMLPEGWEDRLIRIENENTDGAIGWCLEPHDLAFSKLAAQREKDIAFVAALIRLGLVQSSRLAELVESVENNALRETLRFSLKLCRRN
jgi:hypothetical protein